MTVRVCEDADEDEVVALWQRCELVVPPNDPMTDFRRKRRVQPELFLVGMHEDRIVGTVMAGDDGHRGWLYAVAVAPECRRQGLGRQLVAEAEARLRERGCPKINLQVRTSNAAVVGFYESLGYAVEERVSLGKRLRPA